MDNVHPLVIQVDENEYHYTKAGFLLICARVAYQNPANVPIEGQVKAKAAVREMLAVARASGYPNAEIAETLFATSKDDKRTEATAIEVCRHISDSDYLWARARVGLPMDIPPTNCRWWQFWRRREVVEIVPRLGDLISQLHGLD